MSLSHNQPLRLGFLSPYNPYDRQSFSGSTFHACKALSQTQSLRLRVLGQHAPPRFRDRLMRRRKEITLTAADLEGLDAIMGLVATSLLDTVSQLRPDLPFLHVTDATPRFLRDTYGWRVPDNADAREARVAARAASTVYSSWELAKRAPTDLGLAEFQPKVLPFGMNDEYLPEAAPTKPPLSKLNLLFIGLDWVRKGGDTAVAALDKLNSNGRRAHLTIVGQCPERHRTHQHITYAGYLNKNRPREARQLAQLYSDAHLLLLPSLADCTPMVIAEALGHATPVLATDTGGIGTMIGGHATGRLLPQFSAPAEWARTINEMTADETHYAMMSDAGFDRAHGVLTWSRWAAGIVTILSEVTQIEKAAA